MNLIGGSPNFVFVDAIVLDEEEVSSYELDGISYLKTSDKYRRVNSVPWCVLINYIHKRSPLTHDTSLEI